MGGFSISDSAVLNQSLLDLSKEADDNKINELERENEKLQQKIRRLSTTIDLKPEFDNEFDAGMMEPNMEQSEIEQLVEWSRHLSWPQNIMDLYEESVNDNYFDLMQRICMEQQHTNESNAESIDTLNQRINSMNEQ